MQSPRTNYCAQGLQLIAENLPSLIFFSLQLVAALLILTTRQIRNQKENFFKGASGLRWMKKTTSGLNPGDTVS
jgi:hypothetical protein